MCVLFRLKYRTRQKRSACSYLCRPLRISVASFGIASPRLGFGASKVRFSFDHTLNNIAIVVDLSGRFAGCTYAEHTARRLRVLESLRQIHENRKRHQDAHAEADDSEQTENRIPDFKLEIQLARIDSSLLVDTIPQIDKTSYQ